MHSIRPNFTKLHKAAVGRSAPMRLWQRRYWDHVIRDEADLVAHFDYIHYNPVKHGLVTRPEDWPHSSYLDWRRRGCYPERWGWAGVATPKTWNECDVE
jgi:putative transposase